MTVGLTSLNSTGQACQALCWERLLQSGAFPRKPQFLLLRPSTDWMRPTRIVAGGLFFLKSADCNAHRNYKMPSQRYLDSCSIM